MEVSNGSESARYRLAAVLSLALDFWSMGNVSSRTEDGGALVLRDQSRCKSPNPRHPPSFLTKVRITVSIASLTVTNSKGKILLNVVPNVYPATRIIARKDYGDESLVEYIQVIGVFNARKQAG